MTYEYRLEDVKPEITEEIANEKERREKEKKEAYEAEKREIENLPTPQQS
jgi:hypothetical protein